MTESVFRPVIILTCVLALAGCAARPSDDPGSPNLRVVHLSPDAPKVDVFVDGDGPVVKGLAFSTGSDAVSAPTGEHTVQISASGAAASDAVVKLDPLQIEEGHRYTAFAFGKLADIQASSVEDSTQGLATRQVRVRVIHTAEGVGTVDVYAIPAGGTPDLIAEKVRFGTAAPPVDLPTEPFVVGVDVDRDGASDLLFSVPELPAGEVVNVFATVDATGAVFLLAQLPNKTVRLDAAQQRLRVVHLSPDAPAVTPLFAGAPRPEFSAISFASSTAYAALSVTEGDLDLTTGGTVATSVLNKPLTFAAGGSYTAVAVGRVAGLGAIAFRDDATGLAATNARIRAIHAAPDVGQVDLFTVSSDGKAQPLLANLDFGKASDPIDVPAGSYTLGVDVNDDAAPDLYFELPVLSAGSLANVYVTQENAGGVFALLQLDGATTVRINPAQSTVRVLHLSRNAPAVDVYAGGVRAIESLPFKSQSNRLTVPSGGLSVAVTAAGASSSTAVIKADLNLLPGRAYTVVAYDDLASIKALVLVDDAAGLAPENIRVPITHVAPGVTRGDVFELKNGGTTFGTQLVDDFGFGETAPAVDLPAGTYTIGFDAEANGDIQAIFDLPLLTPGTFARAYVFQEQDGSVAVLVQLESSIVIVPAR